MQKYLRVWFYLSLLSFQTFFVSRISSLLFLFGKIIRFGFYLIFLVVLVDNTKVLAGYNLWQVILFYFTFNLIDAMTQMLFREVYRFRQYVVSGNFDIMLVKPVNCLFRSLFGGMDLIDLLTLVPFILFIVYVGYLIPGITIVNIAVYTFLIINALFIATSFHIMVLALALVTTEIDHAIMIYRDFTGMGKLPIDIYREPVRSFITFVIPVGVMMSFPPKALFGLVHMTGILIGVGISFLLFFFSIIFWRYALRHYTSASS